MNYYEIGQRIRSYRKALFLSQEDLAEKVEISTTHMSHIETGNTKLSLAVLVKISSALNVSTDEILFGNPSNNKNVLINKLYRSLSICTPQQIAIISDVIQTLQISLSKNI